MGGIYDWIWWSNIRNSNRSDKELKMSFIVFRDHEVLSHIDFCLDLGRILGGYDSVFALNLFSCFATLSELWKKCLILSISPPK